MATLHVTARTHWPPLPVFFATTEGQAGRVAERIAARLRDRGMPSEAIDLARHDQQPRSWENVRGAVLCASVHAQGHQRVARRFAREHRAALSNVPSLFVSVCLAIESKRPEDREAARKIADSFGAKTGWHPDRTACVAGRLAYTRYGWLKRLMMKRIAAAEGASVDVSRDHEYTDWEQVDSLADELGDRAGIAEVAPVR